MQNRYRHLSDLPSILPVFPLAGATLFPRWQLPLNIFEPRYLNMIDDAMSGERLIGMVQTLGGPRSKPNIAEIGCVGRITTYSETDDGRYTITLSGIVRFRVASELEVTTPYRQVNAAFDDYADDLWPPRTSDEDLRPRLESALEAYTDTNGFTADWDAVKDAPLETLVNALATGCPFEVIEKQALVEAPTLLERCETLIKLLSMSAGRSDDDNTNGPLQ